MQDILVVVDMQNDFIDGVLGTKEAVAIVPKVEERIRNLAAELVAMNIDDEIGSITFVGLCTDICVISNALLVKAALPEVPIIVDAACCAGVTPESHENALNAMKMCQIDIVR